uniref:C2H2-type domain-containing protein n=1 Tax=Steinernema glaseri TaxID=37863 RepID=A0A1I8AG29_9BILA
MNGHRRGERHQQKKNDDEESNDVAADGLGTKGSINRCETLSLSITLASDASANIRARNRAFPTSPQLSPTTVTHASGHRYLPPECLCSVESRISLFKSAPSFARPSPASAFARFVNTSLRNQKHTDKMMSEEPVAKKCRVWNPALEEDNVQRVDDHIKLNEKVTSMENSGPPGMPSFCAPPFVHPHNLPFLINNYFQMAAPFLAHFQQQQHFQAQGALQKVLLDQLAASRNMKHPSMARTPVFPPQPHHQMPPPPLSVAQAPPQSAEVPTTSGRSANPIVLSAIGSAAAPINQNCCAICGSSFRLTGDLVQHMRSNHRNTKYRRRNQPQSSAASQP